MSKHTIFQAQTKNYNELIGLWEASVTATHSFLSKKDIEHYKLLILDYYFDSLKLYCIRDGVTLAGFIGLKDEFIQMLFVAPQAMRKGVGKALINYAITKHDAKTVDVNEQNTGAMAFYKEMGFEIVERYELDAAGKPFPVISLKLAS